MPFGRSASIGVLVVLGSTPPSERKNSPARVSCAPAGLAIRFPRFTGRFREDKEGRDATTSQEILAMYQAQLKRVE